MPTERTVWTRCAGSAGSPLIEIATSPTPWTYIMLNWPGANPNPPGGVNVNVTTPSISRTARSIASIAGT